MHADTYTQMTFISLYTAVFAFGDQENLLLWYGSVPSTYYKENGLHKTHHNASSCPPQNV
jgi:hypothetical protein